MHYLRRGGKTGALFHIRRICKYRVKRTSRCAPIDISDVGTNGDHAIRERVQRGVALYKTGKLLLQFNGVDSARLVFLSAQKRNDTRAASEIGAAFVVPRNKRSEQICIGCEGKSVLLLYK